MGRRIHEEKNFAGATKFFVVDILEQMFWLRQLILGSDYTTPLVTTNNKFGCKKKFINVVAPAKLFSSCRKRCYRNTTCSSQQKKSPIF